MSAYLEEVRKALPLTVRRRVRWGDCDPAGVMYTPRFSEYVVDIFHAFLEQMLGSPLQDKLRELDVSTPAKALTFEFKSSLQPDQMFDMSVCVTAVRKRTFELDIQAVGLEGNEIFSATFTAICVGASVRESRPVPDSVREKLERYREECAAAAGQARRAAEMG